MLSRKMKTFENDFLIDLVRKNTKLTSSGTSPARIDKMLKMTLAPPGGCAELVKIRQSSVPNIQKSSRILSHQKHCQLVYPHPQNF